MSRFVSSVKENGNGIAFWRMDNGAQTTYDKILLRSERWCAALHASGVKSGDRVLAILPPSEECICVFFACVSLGAVYVSVNPMLTLFEMEKIVVMAQAVGVVTTAQLAKIYAPVLMPQREMCFIFTTDRMVDLLDIRNDLTLGVFDPDTGKRRSLDEPSSKTPVTCHFTYKGLGYPLPVEHSYGQYSHVFGLWDIIIKGKKLIQYVGLPIYPVYGLFTSLIAPISSGMTLLLGDNKSRVNLADTFVKYGVQMACLVPGLLLHMVQKLRSKNSNLRKQLADEFLLLVGGSQLSNTLALLTQELTGVVPLQGYGTTETLPCMVNFPDNHVLGSLGRRVSDMQIRVVDAFGHSMCAGKVGEILLKSPCISEGFWRRPRESGLFFQDGWFRTGDLGWLDHDENLFFAGRCYPFTKVGSQMVDLVEIETVATTHPAVARAKALTATNEQGAEEVVLFVVAKRRLHIGEKELARFCRAYLSPHKIPHKIHIYRSQRAPYNSLQE